MEFTLEATKTDTKVQASCFNEKTILEKYLPTQLSEQELRIILEKMIATIGNNTGLLVSYPHT